MGNYEKFYSGGYSSLDPNGQGFVGYRIPASQISMATDPRIANSVKEVSSKLNSGAKNIEISHVNPEVFESIPEQYFDELKRVTKITGATASLHAPIIDPSGFDKQGWTEVNQRAVERQLSNVIEKAHRIDPTGNIPVVFHSTGGLPGTDYEYDKKTNQMVAKNMIGVDVETGQTNRFKEEEVLFLGQGKDILTATERMDMHNVSQWKNSILGLNMNKKDADELLNSGIMGLGDKYDDYLEKANTKEGWKEFSENLNNTEKQAFLNIQKADGMLQHIESQVNNIYEDAVKWAKPSPRYLGNPDIIKDVESKGKEVLNEIEENWEGFVKETQNSKKRPDIAGKSKLLDDTLAQFNQLTNYHFVPQKIIPLEDFAKGKASETFASLALKSYKDYGNTAPIIAIENPPAGGALSTGTDLKELIEKTRKNFIEKAVNDGIGRGEAESAAKKMIGATWDVGHINMIRKTGAGEAELLRQTDQIAPFVKHVHLSDNFGFEHTELPMGMGNVPIRKIMERLGEEGFEGKKVIEAGNWFQHFSEQGKISPLGPTLEAFGSPIYGMNMSPYWNQASGTVGGYSAGFGTMLPEQHFSMYGAGFEQLPLELGGQVQGKNSRFSGAPMD